MSTCTSPIRPRPRAPRGPAPPWAEPAWSCSAMGRARDVAVLVILGILAGCVLSGRCDSGSTSDPSPSRR
eukprot:5001229-Prymnesium_polylepis.1